MLLYKSPPVFNALVMIEVQNLRKTFGASGDKVAVDDISFSVKQGEVLGFLGPNGAGKSTTMRMITGYLAPDSGTAIVDGHDITLAPEAAKAVMGYLPENAPSYPDMTVTSFLNFAAEVRGLSGKERNDAVDRSIEMCFLDPVRHQSIDCLLYTSPSPRD